MSDRRICGFPCSGASVKRQMPSQSQMPALHTSAATTRGFCARRARPLIIGLIAMEMVFSSYAGNIEVTATAQSQTYLANSSGTYTPAGWLLQVGTFASTPTNGSSSLAGFTVFGSGVTGSLGGDFSVDTTADETGFAHTQIYLVAFNAPTTNAATQMGIYYVDMASNSDWRFPASSDIPNSTAIDIDELIANPAENPPQLAAGAHVVFGSTAYDASGPYTQVRLASLTTAGSNFVAAAGTYSGLVESNTPSPETTGSISIKMANTGSFSATLTFGGAHLAFRGQFDDSGDYSTSLVTKLGLTLSISLHAESVNGIDRITGTVSSGSFTSDLTANRSVFNAASNPATQFQSHYTLLLLPDSAAADFPQGTGCGVLTVNAGGTIKLKGTLGDGTKIKQTAVVSQDGSWPVYIPLYARKGLLSGWLTFTNVVGVSDLNGTLTWTKPAQSNARFYRNGFTNSVTAEGARYTRPPAGTPALVVSNAACNVLFTVGAGNLSSFLSNSVTLDAANKLSPCVADKSKFKIALATGLFSGSFPNPTTHKATKFNGALLQKQNLGAGFFLGTNQSGFVTLAPAP